MYTLRNDHLAVSILDPVADRARLGTRYCTGGYLFQIADARHGGLLVSPNPPDRFTPFDGHGIPDAFSRNPLREPASDAPLALVVGIGTCDLQADRVVDWCEWDVREAASVIQMRTEQAFQSFALDLERTVTLHGRTVRSAIRLKNTGRLAIPIRWFPHPFFPQPETDELCRFNVAVRFPESPGYVMGENGFLRRRHWPWTTDYYQALDHDARTNLVVLQRHPALGLVAATCSYVPRFFPIWGNRLTFSWEPYYESTVAPDQETAWWIAYDF